MRISSQAVTAAQNTQANVTSAPSSGAAFLDALAAAAEQKPTTVAKKFDLKGGDEKDDKKSVRGKSAAASSTSATIANLAKPQLTSTLNPGLSSAAQQQPAPASAVGTPVRAQGSDGSAGTVSGPSGNSQSRSDLSAAIPGFRANAATKAISAAAPTATSAVPSHSTSSGDKTVAAPHNLPTKISEADIPADSSSAASSTEQRRDKSQAADSTGKVDSPEAGRGQNASNDDATNSVAPVAVTPDAAAPSVAVVSVIAPNAGVPNAIASDTVLSNQASPQTAGPVADPSKSLAADATSLAQSPTDAQETIPNPFLFQVPTPTPTAAPNLSGMASAGKTQGSDISIKDSGSKPGVSAKGNSTAGTAKGTRKLEDSDTQPSNASTGSTFSVKPQDVPSHSALQNAAAQAGGWQGGSGEAAAQQAIQAGTASTMSNATPVSQEPISSAAGTASSVPTGVPVTADGATTPSVNSAQLIHSVNQSEMRVGMHSTEFGAVSINTSISHQALSAQISTDHSELGRALSMHLPAIEEKLGNAYGLQARVEVRSNGESASGSSTAQSRDGRQSQSGSSSSSSLKSTVGSLAPLSNSITPLVADTTRLDIRI